MTADEVPAPPGSLPPINSTIIPAATLLHRNHARDFRPCAFNPCKGDISRFAPIHDQETGACIPTLYAATTREAAAFETVFHAIEAAASFKTVTIDALLSRVASIIRPKRELRLGSLFAPDLKAWGLERRQIIDTPQSSYRRTAAWARAIHHENPSIHGLIWTSRQCDPDRCVILFGDRTSENDLETADQRFVARDPRLLLELLDYGRRAGIGSIT